MFTFIHEFSEEGRERRFLPAECRDEIILSALLAPLAFTNLRAPLREWVSITDASEQAGGSAEAFAFVETCDPAVCRQNLELSMVRAEASSDVGVEYGKRCSFCNKKTPFLGEWFHCKGGCDKFACSLSCLEEHDCSTCSFRNVNLPCVSFS